METIEDTYNVMLLTVFLYTVILFAFTGFLLVSVSIAVEVLRTIYMLLSIYC